MAPHFEEVKITHEQEKIEPEVLIEDAKQYRNAGSYEYAEIAYKNALSNAMGEPNEAIVARVVNEGLSEVYQLWSQKCIGNNEYPEAESVLKKLLEVTNDEFSAMKELAGLYSRWATMLVYGGSVTEALILYVKALKLHKKMGTVTGLSFLGICRILYSSDHNGLKKEAEPLFFKESFKYRMCLLFSTILLTVIALLLPLFMPYSLIALGGSFMWLIFEDNNLIIAGDKRMKMIGKALLLTALGFAGFFLVGALSDSDSRFLPYILLLAYAFVVFVSLKLMLLCIQRYGILILGKHVSFEKILEKMLPSSTVSCPSCGETVVIPGDTKDAVTCPKCGTVVKEGLDLKVPVIPKPAASAGTSENRNNGSKVSESEAAWGRAAALGLRVLFQALMRRF